MSISDRYDRTFKALASPIRRQILDQLRDQPLTTGMLYALFPDIDLTYASGAPASTPALAEMQAAWQTITTAADPWLDSPTTEQMLRPFTQNGRAGRFNLGSRIHRMIYHYWFHTGENAAIRQLLGHTNLPQYVGPVEDRAPCRLDN
jgi:hypothetical protein